ncbi:MAG: thiamine pyrophosphate-dependent enzyme [Candidatus Nanoarchaeia archaeon]
MILGLPEDEYIAPGSRHCSGCGPMLGLRLLLKAAGKNTIVVIGTGCMEVVTTPYPQTSFLIPVIHNAFENVAATASGIEAALKHQKVKDTKVLAIAGDGGTFDIGLQALSGMIERNHNVCYVCYDNEAYMNTGVQRSGSTPKFASTTTTPYGSKIHGKVEVKKPLPFIIAAHRLPYMATANIAYPQDLYKKVRKAFSVKGPTYIQLFAPCNLGWRFSPALTVNVARLAVETNFSPLYEVDGGVFRLSIKNDKPKQVLEYLRLQGRFKNLTKEEIDVLQKDVNKEYDFLKSLEGKRFFP